MKKYVYIITAGLSHPTANISELQMEYLRKGVPIFNENGKFATNEKEIEIMELSPRQIKIKLISEHFIPEVQASRCLRGFTEYALDSESPNNLSNLLHNKRLFKFNCQFDCELESSAPEAQQPAATPILQSAVTQQPTTPDDLTAQAPKILLKLLQAIDWQDISYREICGMTTAAKLNLLFSVIMTGSVRKFKEEEMSFFDYE